ncbi:cobalt ECF transporter T component CbiQ [Thalassiella azotivora]
MGATHLPHAHGDPASPADGLLVPADTVVHRLPAHTKVLALTAFVLVVVATPATAWPAFAGYAVLLAGVVLLARVPARTVARRSLVETPFVVFALLLPFVAEGPRVDVAGLGLSRVGLVGGGLLLAKATLGVVAAIVLAATTAPRELLVGLERLRMPRLLVAILSFMVRYASVVVGDLHRMRVARESRGFTGGRLRHLAAVAAGTGALFVRSYERGERVHLAMLARGYTGRMPRLADDTRTPATTWAAGALLPLAALGVLLAVLVVQRAAAGGAA